MDGYSSVRQAILTPAIIAGRYATCWMAVGFDHWESKSYVIKHQAYSVPIFSESYDD